MRFLPVDVDRLDLEIVPHPPEIDHIDRGPMGIELSSTKCP